jgi:uncharacterized protein with beta-barrel porin domain
MSGIGRGRRISITLTAVTLVLLTLPVIVLAQSQDIAALSGLTQTQRNMGAAIDVVCPALAGLNDPTGTGRGLVPGSAQQDLFYRCREMRNNAFTITGGTGGGAANSLGFPSATGPYQLVLSGLTPDEAASQGATVSETRAFRGTIGTRLAAVRAGATGVRISGLQLDGGAVDRSLGWSEILGDAADGTLSRLGLFLNGHGSFGSRDDSDREPGFDFHDGGFTLGADYRFADSFVAGVAFTFVAGNATFNANLGDTDSRSYGLTAYATYSDGRFYLDGAFGFAWNTYDTSRNIFYTAGPGATGTACLVAPVGGVCTVPLVVDRTAKGDTDGYQFSFNIGMGYDFPIGALTITPTLRIETIYLNIDGYREKGAFGLDLQVKKQEILSVQSALGGRVAYAISTGVGVFVPQISAEWRHEFEDDSRNIKARYVNDVSNTFFSVPTDDPDRDYVALGAGLSVLLGRGIGAFFNYETALALKRVTHHQFTAGFRMEF